MPDIRIVQISTPEAVTLDFLLTPIGTLDDTAELETAAVVALGTDRRARDDDELPDDTEDRRGWWGDTEAAELWDGWPIGTRLWLLQRASITGPRSRRGSTLRRVEDYIAEAMQPFLDRRIASRYHVEAERVGTDRIDAVVTLYRGPLPAVELRFADLWKGIKE